MPKRNTYDTGVLLNAIADEFGAGDEEEVEVVNDDGVIPDKEDQPAAAKVEKPEAEPTKPAVTADAEPTQVDRPWADDYADLRSKFDFLQGYMERQARPTPTEEPTKPAAEAPRPWREITEPDEYGRRMEQLEQTARASYQAIKAMELSHARRNIAELKAELPDIDQLIPESEIQRAIDLRVQQGNFGGDWKEPLMRAYDFATGGKRHQAKENRIKELEAELQKVKDEVAQKRAERVSKDTEAAAQVPAGGSVYQESSVPKVPQVGRNLRGVKAYNAAARAMQEALAHTGG